MTKEDREKARGSILFLIDLLIKLGISDGCDSDYDGGSYADDLRGLAKTWELDLPSGK